MGVITSRRLGSLSEYINHSGIGNFLRKDLSVFLMISLGSVPKTELLGQGFLQLLIPVAKLFYNWSVTPYSSMCNFCFPSN